MIDKVFNSTTEITYSNIVYCNANMLINIRDVAIILVDFLLRTWLLPGWIIWNKNRECIAG